MNNILEQKLTRFFKKHQFGGVVLLVSVLLFMIAFTQIIPVQASFDNSESKKEGCFLEHVTTRVAVSFEGQRYNFFSRENNIKEAFQKEGLILDKRDGVSPTLNTELDGGEIVVAVQKARPVVIIDNNLRFETKAKGETIGEIFEALKLKVHPEDTVLPPKETEYEIGTEIIIDRAKQITILNYDQKLKVRTKAGTVKEVLAENKIKLQENDQVKPALSASVADRSVIHIFEEGTKVLEETVSIHYKVIYQDDPNLSIGEQAVVQEGRDGEKTQMLKIVLYNGVVVDQIILSEKIIKEPRSKIIKQGTKTGGTSYTGTATWYGPGFYGNHTANGEILDKTSLTAAHLNLPFGTRVKVINLNTGRSCIVRINDRGPYGTSHIIDLSVAAKNAVGMGSVALVRLEVLN